MRSLGGHNADGIYVYTQPCMHAGMRLVLRTLFSERSRNKGWISGGLTGSRVKVRTAASAGKHALARGGVPLLHRHAVKHRGLVLAFWSSW